MKAIQTKVNDLLKRRSFSLSGSRTLIDVKADIDEIKALENEAYDFFEVAEVVTDEDEETLQLIHETLNELRAEQRVKEFWIRQQVAL